ncbi:MAG: hypothetical protein CV087_22500 [Candidatus Brocadia sp. WS118]|nr:MAG: hypothetical protein CV087_22500 [Candidatus Brocadia sp. WS118]
MRQTDYRIFHLIILSGILFGVLFVVISELPAIKNTTILSGILQSFGISITTLFTISFTWQQISERALFERISAHLGIAKAAESLGLVNIYKDRNEASQAIKNALSEAKGDIALFGGALTTFFLVPTSLIDLDSFLENNSNVQSLRILLPDPFSKGTELRSMIDHGKVPSYVYNPENSTQKRCLDKAAILLTRFPEKISLRIYKMFPHCFLVITKTKLFWQPYDCSDRGVTAPVMEALSGSTLYRRYQEHFNRIWHDDKLSFKFESESTRDTSASNIV